MEEGIGWLKEIREEWLEKEDFPIRDAQALDEEQESTEDIATSLDDKSDSDGISTSAMGIVK